MKIVCFGYRAWALEIYKSLQSLLEHEFFIYTQRENVDYMFLSKINPDLVLFYGWSWYVPITVLENFTCLMLHPSKLPEFRGGTPIQNQIIRGVTSSATTIFIMTENMDEGDIVSQRQLSLKGSMSEILCRIRDNGIHMTIDLLQKGLYPVKQDSTKSSSYKRLKTEDSEIKPDDFHRHDAFYIYNKIRMLQDPYPNAFIVCKDGTKLYLTDAYPEPPDGE